MLPGMKHWIEITSSNSIGQTMVRPTRFGSVITASSGSFRIPSGHRYIRSIAFRDQLDNLNPERTASGIPPAV